jgi:ketosteroid isomerase-like protein
MSEATVQLARHAFADYQRDGVDGLLPHVHEDFEATIPPEMSAEPDTYRGHDGMRRYFALWEEQIDDLTFLAGDPVDTSGDDVVVEVLITGRGRGSGVPVELRAFIRVSVRDGLVDRMSPYFTLEEALAA